jgi:hypothetical protein
MGRSERWLIGLAVAGASGCAATLEFDSQAFVEADSGPTGEVGVDAEVDADIAVDTGAAADTEQLFDARQDTEADTAVDSSCVPRPEVCDGADNDCDGLVDAADPTVVWDASNCGSCGEACDGAPMAEGLCGADFRCSVQRCSAAGYRDLNGLYEDGCEFSVGAPLHWLSRLSVSGFTQVDGRHVVAWGDTGAQLYETGAAPSPVGAFGHADARTVSAEVVGSTLLLGMESISDGTGLIYRHPIGSPFVFDEAASPVRLSRPPTDIAVSLGRVLVSSAGPGIVQGFEEVSGTYRFLGSVNPFSGADVLGLAVSDDGATGYAIARDGGCRALVFSATGAALALGGGSVPGDGVTEAIAQASTMQSGRLVVAMLLRTGGSGGGIVRLVSDAGAGPVATDVALGSSDGVSIGTSGGGFRVLHATGAVSRLAASGVGGVELLAAPTGVAGARAFGPGASQWLLATDSEVAVATATGAEVAVAPGSRVDLTPRQLVSVDGGWLLASGRTGVWSVAERPEGGVTAVLREGATADFVAAGADGALFSVSAEGSLRGWVAEGEVAAFETGLTGVVAFEAGLGWLVFLTESEAVAQAYRVAGGLVSLEGSAVRLPGRFGALTISGDRVALSSGVEVAWYQLSGGWQFGGRLAGPSASAGAVGLRWNGASLLAVMDVGAGLWSGDTVAGGQLGAAITGAAAGVRSDAANGLFGRGGLMGWRSGSRGVALWFADTDGSIRLGTLDATRPGTTAYLATPCPALAGDTSATTVGAATGCGVTLWRHRPSP